MRNMVVLLGLTALMQVPPPNTALDLATTLREEQATLLERERTQLKELADSFAKQGKAEAAAQARAQVERLPQRNGPIRFVPLAEVVAAPRQGLADVAASRAAPAAMEPAVQAIRLKTAQALLKLADRAQQAQRYALADHCLRKVLERDPNEAEARRLLGFVPYEGGWATPFAVQKLKAGQVLHPLYGWVPADWVKHLERDELPAPVAVAGQTPRWVSRQQADELHSDWSSAWQIPTEHFLIRTNVPLAEAIAFGRQLEDLHQLFFSILADVIGAERLPLAQRYANTKTAGTSRRREPHRVFYFASKAQFVEYLTPRMGPGADEILGYYLTPRLSRRHGERPTSYFYRDPEAQIDATATLYHEVSHQILFESAGAADFERNQGDYWVFEGLGTYFETLTRLPDGSLEVGGLVGPRMALARQRLLDQNEFLPVEQLVAMRKARFDERGGQGDVYLRYIESMALAIFLMQYDRGFYREGFLTYVADAYHGQVRGGNGKTLDRRLDVSFATLNTQFHKFLEDEAPRPSKAP